MAVRATVIGPIVTIIKNKSDAGIIKGNHNQTKLNTRKPGRNRHVTTKRNSIEFETETEFESKTDQAKQCYLTVRPSIRAFGLYRKV